MQKEGSKNELRYDGTDSPTQLICKYEKMIEDPNHPEEHFPNAHIVIRRNQGGENSYTIFLVQIDEQGREKVLRVSETQGELPPNYSVRTTPRSTTQI